MHGYAFIFVGLGAGIGAVSRYLISLAFFRLTDSVFPLSTWVINFLGTALLGYLLFGLSPTFQSTTLFAFVGPGFCGGFTTFSTMVQESVSLFRARPVIGVVYLLTSLGGGLLIASMISIAFRH